MEKAKVVFAAIAMLLTLIVVLQNTETVETSILFMTISLPRAALLFGTMVIGFLLGVLTSGRILARKQRAL